MIRRTFDLEDRLRFGPGNQCWNFQVEVYRWQIFGLTIWKTETLH
ncbi:MAG: hypothetical protein AAGI03_00550 [Pseudomonadota bacterium]